MLCTVGETLQILPSIWIPELDPLCTRGTYTLWRTVARERFCSDSLS